MIKYLNPLPDSVSFNPILSIKPYILNVIDPRLHRGLAEEMFPSVISYLFVKLLNKGGYLHKKEIMSAMEICFGLEREETEQFFNMAMETIKENQQSEKDNK